MHTPGMHMNTKLICIDYIMVSKKNQSKKKERKK